MTANKDALLRGCMARLRHRPQCAVYRTDPKICSCGFSELQSAVVAALAEQPAEMSQDKMPEPVATPGQVCLTEDWLFVGDSKRPIANFNFGGAKKSDRELIAHLVNNAEAIAELIEAAEFYEKHGLSVPVYNKDGTCYFADEPLKKALAKIKE